MNIWVVQKLLHTEIKMQKTSNRYIESDGTKWSLGSYMFKLLTLAIDAAIATLNHKFLYTLRFIDKPLECNSQNMF